MKKASLSLLASLIALGLLFTGSTNAMTYTVNGTGTQVAIPSDTSEGITINWGDGTSSVTLATDCGASITLPGIGEEVYKCTREYEDGLDEHNVTISNSNETVTHIYLNNSNIAHIDNFGGFNNLKTIYLKNNKISDVDENTFQGLSDLEVHLEFNQIETFEPGINNIKYLYLSHNSLTTIPDNIRNYNGTKFIKLSNNKRYGSGGGKIIDLSNNNIKFIKLTEIDRVDSSEYYPHYDFEDPTDNQFGRFGYSYENPNNLSFDYQILDINNNTIISDETSETSVVINPLQYGDYRFKVCLHNDNSHCDDGMNFTVNYNDGIYPDSNNTNPQGYGSSITSLNEDIYFSRYRLGNYPESLVSGYYYTLTKDSSQTIDSRHIPDGPAPYGYTTYHLESNLIPANNPNGYYIFKVQLIDKEGTPIYEYRWDFYIEIDNSITIISPKGTQLGSGVNEVNVNFEWSTSNSPSYYDYYITDDNGCSPSAHVITGSTGSNSSFTHQLGIGSYVFCVDMYDSNNNRLNDETAYSGFSVEIPATVSIISPDSTVTNQPVGFAWDSFLPDFYTFTNYTYTVKKGNEVFLSGIIDNINDKSFTGDIILSDGTYTFNLTMNYNNGSVDTSKTFNINTSAGAYLNLTPNNGETIPGNHVKQVTLTPSWNGGGSTLISGYSYSLTNMSTSEVIDSGNIQKNDSGTYSLSEKLLPSGTYKFEVTMLDSNNNTILNESSNFTIVIPSELEILSPSEGLQTTKNITFSRLGFAEFEDHYSYQLNKIGSTSPITGNDNTNATSFTIENMANGQYTFTVSMLNSLNTAIESRTVNFSIPDSQDLTLNISDGQHSVNTLNSRTGIFSRGGTSENFDSYSYSIEGTTFNNESFSYTGTSRSTAGEFTLNNLSTGRYRFTVTMLDSNGAVITGRYLEFDVTIPATIKITSPANGATITTASTTFTWSGYSDVITQYKYELTSTSYSIDETFTNSTSATVNNLKDGSYTLNVWLLSGDVIVAQDSINFTVAIPSTPSGGGGGGGGGGGSGGGSSGKTHYNNSLKLSLGTDSPSVNQWIKLIVKIDEKYTGKVFFPKIQYYSPDTEKWIDLPMTSKTYVSEYGDEAKLGYTKFTSDDDGRKNLSEFIKFSKSGYYRIYAEDKDGYDDYVEFKVSNTKNTQTPLNTSGATNTNNTNNNIDSVIQKYIPDIYEQQHTQEEVYVARSCKKYTITYSDYLNAYTSPNLNVAEYFVNKDYFKRYLDSKNKYQSGCPTNIGWISTSYVDKTNDNTKYVAPNGKVYFIKGQEGNYYSSELNGNAKTPSFRTVQELKYYIRDRNPLISMATLGPTN